MRLSLIAAMAEGGVIGRGGGLPWHLPADLARFKRLTMGHHLIVGRRTWESIGRALPGRRMVVVSRAPERLGLPAEVGGARTLDEAVEVARAAGDEEAFVGGGAGLFREALPRADRLYLTRVHAAVEGDTFFPPLDLDGWREVEREERAADERNAYPTTFVVLDRYGRSSKRFRAAAFDAGSAGASTAGRDADPSIVTASSTSRSTARVPRLSSRSVSSSAPAAAPGMGSETAAPSTVRWKSSRLYARLVHGASPSAPSVRPPKTASSR
jgi:dihydrofolate reductase